MEAASLRTISPARALAGAPARTSARLAARLFALGVIGPLDTRSLSRGCLPWPSTHSQRKNPDPTRQAGEGRGRAQRSILLRAPPGPSRASGGGNDVALPVAIGASATSCSRMSLRDLPANLPRPVRLGMNVEIPFTG